MGKLRESTLRSWLGQGRPIQGKSDGDGLTFTLSKAGTASWVFRYRIAGRQREVTLGNYPDMSLDAARKAATRARVGVDEGMDVATEKRRAKVDAARAGTFRVLAEDYLTRGAAAMAPRSRKEIARYLSKDILPRLGHLPAGDVTGGDVVTVIERIAERSDSVARHAFEMLSVIFAHGVAKHAVAVNPCAGLKLSAILGPASGPRPRIMLTDLEIRALMARLPALGKVNALAIKILLATCVQENELRARAELAERRSQLEAISLAVLVGEATEAQEADVLAKIEAAERVVRRCELGRPLLEARIRAVRQGAGPFARAVDDAFQELEEVRRQVREELARAAL